VEFVYARPEPEARPLELLGHLMISEQVWFDRIEGRKESEVMFPILEKAALLRGFDENAETYRGLIAGRLEEVVHFRRMSGEEYHARVFDIVHHLLTHGYHHRGQLAAIYGRMGGVKSPNTDHINFLIVNRL
jgi:uncharacterized damage-inducible protein DinB